MSVFISPPFPRRTHCFHIRFSTVASTLEVSACLSEQNVVSLVELLFNNHVSAVQGQFRHFCFKCRNKSEGATCAKSKIEGAGRKEKFIIFVQNTFWHKLWNTTDLSHHRLPAHFTGCGAMCGRMDCDSFKSAGWSTSCASACKTSTT